MSAPHGIHTGKDVELHQRFGGILFTWVSTNKAQPRLGLYETALESSHYDTIHPLTTQGMARSIARSLHKVPALQAQLEGFRV